MGSPTRAREAGEFQSACAPCHPGEKYVDVLASDIHRYGYRQSHCDELPVLTHGKPVAPGEVGELPMLDVLAQQPDWT